VWPALLNQALARLEAHMKVEVAQIRSGSPLAQFARSAASSAITGEIRSWQRPPALAAEPNVSPQVVTVARPLRVSNTTG
jgi:hypothetical protein